jgi:uncharacterized membrane protein
MRSKNILFFSILLISSFFLTGTIFAHGSEKHNNKKAVSQIVQPTITKQTVVNNQQIKAKKTQVVAKQHIPTNKIQHKNQKTQKVFVSIEDFPSLHPLVVHFPVVLFPIGFLIYLISFLKKDWRWIAVGLVAIGFGGAVVASYLLHPHTNGLTAIAQKTLEEHDFFAYLTVALGGVGTLLGLLTCFEKGKKRALEIVVALILFGSTVTVSIAGHYGATLTFIHNVGPQGKFLELNDNH